MIDLTKFAETLNGKPVAVFGLGVSNRAVVKALAAANVEVVTADDTEPQTTRRLLTENMARFACLVLTPGVPRSHPIVKKALWCGMDIVCDMDILHCCGHGRKTIGITGTNGKSTTTALIGHILNECGVPAAVGGNIGRPVLDLDMPPENGAFVLEMSSYQLDLCPSFAPDIAVWLNVTSDHIDHHGSMKKYVAAKKNIFRGSGNAVIAKDDSYGLEAIKEIELNKGRIVHAVSMHDENMPDCNALPGAHNKQNMAAAFAVAKIIGLADDKIYDAMKTFPGLPHRQQFVRALHDVRWINDSKATNPDAASKALICYDSIYWIVGGRSKEGGPGDLVSYMDKIRHAFLIGEAQEELAEWMKQNNVSYECCGTLEKAVMAAHDKAKSGDTVLLSPACSSFDQFKSFEHRGEAFMALVHSLKEKAA